MVFHYHFKNPLDSYMENPPVFTATYSPITESVHEETEATSRCFCFGWDSHNKYLLQEREESWVVHKLKKVREFSELVAGPKWKNFIRKIGRFCNPRKYNKTTRFQYSPESYALNFQEHEEEEDEENGDLMHNFSSRFAPHALINDPQRRADVLS